MNSLHGPVKVSKLSPEELAEYRAMDKPVLRESDAKSKVDYTWPLRREKRNNESSRTS